ncbi:MAG: hypothetical protein IIC91_08365 [Chloroflexi bacterium]|nr:hypothetical protein [Chloroflexota bacterium]
MSDYDFMIIGCGAAAFAAATRAWELGRRTTMINDGLPIMADNAGAVASCLSLNEETR